MATAATDYCSKGILGPHRPQHPAWPKYQDQLAFAEVGVAQVILGQPAAHRDRITALRQFTDGFSLVFDSADCPACIHKGIGDIDKLVAYFARNVVAAAAPAPSASIEPAAQPDAGVIRVVHMPLALDTELAELGARHNTPYLGRIEAIAPQRDQARALVLNLQKAASVLRLRMGD